MSERMIELHRAKLGLVASPSSQSAAASPNKQRPGAGGPKLTPKEAAKAAILVEDSMMAAFIDRLQKRDDSKQVSMLMVEGATSAATTTASATAAAESATRVMGSDNAGPTVPTALSRRMLHRQGVGYLDGTVASVVSASADRFLATVLQQSMACRDQRLNGARMAKKAERDRKRHQRHYKADVDDRKRRKAEIEKARETVALQTIQVAEGVRRENQSRASAAVQEAAAAAKGETVKRRKRPPPASASPANGVKIDPVLKKLAEEDENEDGYDSIDEEEEYYQQKMGGLDVDDDGENGAGDAGGDDDVDDEDDDDDDDEEEEDVTLLLRDIVRPLEAWDFRLAGKETMPTQPAERHQKIQNDDDDDDEGDDELDDKDSDSLQQAEMDNGNDDDMNGVNGDKVSSTNGS